MTFSIDNPEGGCNNPPLGKYVWEKPSGEQGLTETTAHQNFDHILLYISNSDFCFLNQECILKDISIGTLKLHLNFSG